MMACLIMNMKLYASLLLLLLLPGHVQGGFFEKGSKIKPYSAAEDEEDKDF
jgi:uncharacterized membrane protein